MCSCILSRPLAMGKCAANLPLSCRLKDLDILLMKSVGKRVNIIPVIAKSDALTRSELLSFKQQVISIFYGQVISDIKKYHIPIYEFEPHDFDESDVIQFKENAKVPIQTVLIIAAIFAICHRWSGARIYRHLKVKWHPKRSSIALGIC